MGFLLAQISLILFVVVYFLDGITMLFIDVKDRKWYKTTEKRKFTKAFKVDVFGNNLFGNFWNLIFSTGGYLFGRFGETISSCLGRKKLENTLSLFGLFSYYILYGLDYTKWKQGGHCIASIMTEQEITNFLK